MENISEVNRSNFIINSIIEKTKELDWKQDLKNELNKEEKIEIWSLDLDSKVKKVRLKELKRRGLI